jgi:hypothetical protein
MLIVVQLAGYQSYKAGAGIEPANSGFADRDLTTWLPRQEFFEAQNIRVSTGSVNA